MIDNLTLGTAPDSWGVWHASDPRQTPWQRFLDEVAEAGYDGIDLGPPGFLGGGFDLGDRLRAAGLALAGGYAPLPFTDPPALEETLSELEALLDAFDSARDPAALNTTQCTVRPRFSASSFVSVPPHPISKSSLCAPRHKTVRSSLNLSANMFGYRGRNFASSTAAASVSERPN